MTEDGPVRDGDGPARAGGGSRGGGELERWLDLVCPELDLDRDLVAALTRPVLDRVRDVAHGVVRPGAPLTAMLVGLAAGAAAGAGAPPGRTEAEVHDRLAVVDRLVAAWAEQHP